MNITLRELTDSYINLLDLDLEEEQVKEYLNEIKDAIEQKADNIASIITSIKSDIDTLDTEIKRLSQKKSTLDNRTKYLKTYLQEEMQKMGKEKIKTTLYSFNIQKNPASLKIISEDNIPQNFYKIEKTLKKQELLKEIKNGLEVDGIELQTTKSLRIR